MTSQQPAPAVEEHRPSDISDVDYLPELGLARIEELVSRMPHDFELAGTQVYPKAITATLRFDTPKDVFKRGNDLDNLLNAAMCVDTLCKNLRAERAESARLRAELEGR